ncbi:MAG: selenium-dependent xanthine dehydrogenase [Bacteroidales bacterium]|nr:selenium-dependent xanthine dehydrogenase [Bacteroidales bacterium]
MIKLKINNKEHNYSGDGDLTLLKYLRNELNITSVKDGCSGQGVCGACTVEINGKAKLSCMTKMKSLQSAEIITMEGIPDTVREIIGKAFVEKGAVQCGFCTPGFIMRTKVLFQENKNPSREEIKKAMKPNLCRCTGYVKILDAIELASKSLNENKNIEFSENSAKIGKPYRKYQALETALGKRNFVDDIRFEGMLHAALKFSEHPRAKVIKIDISKAEKLEGVVKIFIAKDIPGKRFTGLIFQDWPLMIAEGEITNYIGDVLAGVVAETEDIARKAIELIDVEYEELQAVSDMLDAIKDDSIQVHSGKSNILEKCIVKNGNAQKSIHSSAFIAHNIFQTQRIEHAFLETEAAIGKYLGDNKIELYSQGQGVYVDRKQIASILGLSEENINVILVPNGGGFGGKEDLTVQGHAALFSYNLKSCVKLSLTREESIRMHPKRHPVYMDMTLACDKKGKLTALKLWAVGDTGAYASVGTKVLERVAGHASGGYYVSETDIEAITVYTNNIPCGAMRGFGANQVVFALESLVDELCKKGGFDRWQFRYDNALTEGLKTATGQVLKAGVGIRKTLLAVKDEFYKAKYAGLACGIKNSGVGNGMIDESKVIIEIKSPTNILIQHGWTEMGQGVQNMAIQTLCQETGIDPDFIEVKIETNAGIPTGMTTSSRATALLGNAIIDAAKKINQGLENSKLEDIVGNIYFGSYVCDWTTKPGDNVKEIITHYSYGYATQLVVLNDKGEIDCVYAAHDAGKIMNPMFFEGQIQGAVNMGLGYALCEELPMENGKLKSDKLKDCKILRTTDMPKVVVIGVEEADPVGPYGAKGIGEIGLVPTAGAVANAFCCFDGKRRTKLPLREKR